MSYYQPGFLREQREKQAYQLKHKGRGKYERTLHQYFIDVVAARDKENASHGIAWGWSGMLKEKRVLVSRFQETHTAYRVQIYNATAKRWVKK